MATYRQIHTHIWDDPDFEELSPHAKLVFIYGFSNRHRNEAGLYTLTIRKLAFETGLSQEEAEAAVREIEARGMWRYDWDNQVLWVKNALKYQTVTETNLAAIKKEIAAINSPLVAEFESYYSHLLAPAQAKGKGQGCPIDGGSKGEGAPIEGPEEDGPRGPDAPAMDNKGIGKGIGIGKGKEDITPPPHHPPPLEGEGEASDQDNPPNQDKSKTKHEYPPEFEQFWQVYPRRVEKLRAFKAWQARIREKVPPADLIAAARQYAEKCRREGTEERFIKHPSTFLGPARPYEDYIRPPTPMERLDVPKAWHKLRRYFEEENENDDQGGNGEADSLYNGGLPWH